MKTRLETGDFIEMKSIKHSVFASQETYCYQADIWLNGKKFAQVSNDGRGGCDNNYMLDDFTYADYTRIDDACKASLPKWSMLDDKKYDTDLEMWCSEQVSYWLDKKEFNKLIKKGILVLEDSGEVSVYSFKGVNKIQESHIKVFVDRHPEYKLLNTMDKDKALELFYHRIEK